MTKMYSKLGHAKEPELIAKAAKSVKLTTVRSNTFAALIKVLRRKLGDIPSYWRENDTDNTFYGKDNRQTIYLFRKRSLTEGNPGPS